jgi:NO-binding membrane sensor protein with MHYT domain
MVVVLEVVYNPGLVLLASGVSLLGGFATVQLCEQYRMSVGSKSPYKYGVLALTGATIAAVVVWGVHFIVMTSLSLRHDGETVLVKRSAVMAPVSLIMCIFIEILGLYIASTDVCFNKSSNEIIEMFIAQTTNKYTMSQIKAMGNLKMMSIVLSHRLERIFVGGVLGGGGVVAMHYTALTGMKFQGEVVFDTGMVVLSVVVAMIVMTSMYFVFFRVLSVFPSFDFLRNIVAFVSMLNSGVHYIALSAVTFVVNKNSAPIDNVAAVDSQAFFTGVIVATVIYVTMVSVYSISDLRSWLLCTSIQLRRAEALILNIKRRTAGSQEATCNAIGKEVQRYFLRSKLTGTSKLHDENGAASATLPMYYDVNSDEDSNHSGGGMDSSNGSAQGTLTGATAKGGGTPSSVGANSRKPSRISGQKNPSRSSSKLELTSVPSSGNMKIIPFDGAEDAGESNETATIQAAILKLGMLPQESKPQQINGEFEKQFRSGASCQLGSQTELCVTVTGTGCDGVIINGESFHGTQICNPTNDDHKHNDEMV